MKRNNKLNLYIKTIVILFSFFSSIYVYFNTLEESGYSSYFLIPLLFGILSLFTVYIDYTNISNPGIFILNYTAIVKYAISPIISCIGNYSSWLGVYPSEVFIKKAIAITIIELITVMLFNNFMSKINKKNEKKNNEIEGLKKNFILKIFVVLAIIVFFFFPKALADHRFIFDTSNLDVTIRVDFPFSGIFKTIFLFGRYSLVLLVINYFYKRNQKKQSIINIFGSFIAVFLNALYNSNLSRISLLVPMIAFFIVIFMLFDSKKERKIILNTLCVTVIAVIIFMSAIKFFGKGRGNEGNANNINWWGDTLNMYFTGIKETAIGFRAEELIEENYGVNRLKLLWNDTMSNVIGASNFTKHNINSTKLYNVGYFMSNIAVCQIVPNIIEGYYYFGIALCFIWPIIFISLSYYFNNKCKVAKTLDLKFAFVYSNIYCGMILMINSAMIIANIINVTILFICISKINSKIVINKEKNSGGNIEE